MANALETLFTETANSIRGGLPDVGKMSPSVFPEKIDEIVANGKNPALQEKTVTPTTSQQEVTPDAEYDGLSKVTVEAMQVSNTESPVIEVSDEGLVQASVQHNEGYVAADEKTTSTKQLPTQAAKAVTPSANEQVAVEAGVFTTGAVAVAGDPNLVPENIKSGVSIFGVDGTHEGGIDVTLIEGMEIALDLSDGNQLLSVPDGYAVKSAIIEKPETLIPENIAQGVDIAGVVGTLESGGGGGGDGAMGVTTIAFFKGYPSTKNSNPIKGDIYLQLPEDAIVEWANFYCRVQNNAGGSLANITFTPTNYTITESEISSMAGYNEAVFLSYSVTNSSGGYYYGRPLSGSAAIIKFPNAYIENNIIHAGANCKGLFVGGDKASSGVNQRDSLYFEGVDLRGSQVQTLPEGFGNGHTELKKIWLSDVFSFMWTNPFDGILSQLDEFHFVTTTPPTLYSYRNLNELPTTCKIYVPAGSLGAYTTAQYYPDPSTYTYIEE